MATAMVTLCVSKPTYLLNFVNKSELSKVLIKQPTTKVEQAAIATILPEMDADISVLEIKCAKAQQIKQGMMQELLTGRIRLV